MNSLKRLRQRRAGSFTPSKTVDLWPNPVVVAQLQMRETLGSRLALFMMGKPLYVTVLKENWKKHPYTRRRGIGMKRARNGAKKFIGAKR